jgi:dihydrodipicolinate synthase/N-acetylneuraminate lyase
MELAKLHEEGAIGGVKYSNMLPDRMVDLLQATNDRLPVYAGIDFVAFETLCHGGYGWISGIPSIVPKAANRLYRAIVVDGDLKQARELWKDLAPLMRFIFETRTNHVDGAHWLGIMKASLNMTGPDVGEPLPPSGSIDTAQKKKLAGLLKALGYEIKSN